jgi:hypothetical protein
MMKISPPDDERRGDDQDPGLTQRLAEEAEHLQPEDLADDRRTELDDLPERGDPVARHAEPCAAHHTPPRRCEVT